MAATAAFTVARRDREGHVGPIEAQVDQGGVVQRGRKGVFDRVADDTGQSGPGRRPRPQGAPRTSQVVAPFAAQHRCAFLHSTCSCANPASSEA